MTSARSSAPNPVACVLMTIPMPAQPLTPPQRAGHHVFAARASASAPGSSTRAAVVLTRQSSYPSTSVALAAPDLGVARSSVPTARGRAAPDSSAVAGADCDAAAESAAELPALHAPSAIAD